MSAPRARSRFLGVTLDRDPASRGGPKDPAVGRPLFDQVVHDSTVRVHGLITPEGVLGVATCVECGRRHELLARCPGTSKGRAAAGQWVLDTLADESSGPHPCGGLVVPQGILRVADLEVRRLLSALGHGAEAAPRAVLVIPGRPIAVHIPPLSAIAGEERARLNALVTHRLRVQCERQRVGAEGFVAVAVERDPLGQPSHLDAVIASPDIALVGKAPVHAGSGPEALGLGEWDWHPVSGPHGSIDGVLAKATPLPRRA